MYLLLEFVLVISLLSTLMIGFMEIYKHNSFEQRRIDAINRSVFFEEALKGSFLSIIDTVRNNCNDGYNSLLCSNTTPLPTFSNNGNDLTLTYTINSSLPDRSTLSNKIIKLYDKANCSGNDDGTIITITCRNTNILSEIVPTQILDLSVIPLYQFKFGFLGKAGAFIWLGKDISFQDIYSNRLEQNKALFLQIAETLKEYHLRRRIEEANNTCRLGGGLHSTDDTYIPWVMQGYTADINALCNTSTDTVCSCTNITWDTVNQANRATQIGLINVLSGGGIKLVDYFGNQINVFAIVDETDVPYNPPNPAPAYTDKPPYTGLIRLDNTFPCTTGKQEFCYLKFVYPN